MSDLRHTLPDGRVLVLTPANFNRWRLLIFPPGGSVADGAWDFYAKKDAEFAFLTWDGEGRPHKWDQEPHPSYILVRDEGSKDGYHYVPRHPDE